MDAEPVCLSHDRRRLGRLGIQQGEAGMSTVAELIALDRQDNTAYLDCMKKLRAAAQDAERLLGGPVAIVRMSTDHQEHSYVTTFTFQRAPTVIKFMR
jgi:hypothetical protein